MTPLVTTSGTTSSKSSRTRSARAVENRFLRGIARRWERDLQRQKREEEDNQEVEQEIPAFGQSTAACDSERSASHTTSSQPVDYSAFLAPAVRLSRPLEGEIGGVYRRVWNNLQRKIPHVAGEVARTRSVNEKELFVCRSQASSNRIQECPRRPSRAESGQAKVVPKVEVEGFKPKNQNKVKEELDENTRRQRSTEPKRRRVSAGEIPSFAGDIT